MRNKATMLFVAVIVCVGGFRAMAGTLAYWQFDETGGGVVVDSSTNGHDMVVGNSETNTVGNPARVADGYSYGAYRFSSEDIGDVVKFENSDEATHVPAVTPTSTMDWTVEAFFKLSEIPQTWGSGDSPNTLFEWKDTSGRSNWLRIRRQTVGSNYGQMDATYWDGSTYKTLLHPALLDTNIWYFVAESYDATTGTRKLWIDDASATDTPDAVNLGTPHRFSIGSSSWNVDEFSRSFDGVIDEVRISDAVVAENDMLFHTVPEPTHVGLLAISCLGALLFHRSRIR